jgi:hypothetical protein
MNRVLNAAALLILGLISGVIIARIFPTQPRIAPAPIIQPPTGGPNAALLYWRYASIIPSALARAAADERKAVENPSPNLTTLLVDHQDVVAGLIRAAAIEHCDFNLEYDSGIEHFQLSHVDIVRDAAGVLALDARRLAAAGDTTGAVDRIEALLRMGAHMRSDRVLIASILAGMVTATACDEIDRLDLQNVNEPERARLLAAIAFMHDEDPIGYKAALAGEKRVALSSDVFAGQGMRGLVLSGSARTISDIFDDAISVWDDEDALTKLDEIQKRAERDWTGVAGIAIPSFTGPKKAEQQILDRLRRLESALTSDN